MVDHAKAIIITVNSEHPEAILGFCKNANIIIKIDSVEERKSMRDLPELEFVDASFEISHLLVNKALKI